LEAITRKYSTRSVTARTVSCYF